MKDVPAPKVSLAKLFGVFLYIGATSFGGAVVAYLRDYLVSRQKWLDEDQFLAAYEIGTAVPGLIATNVAVIVGSHLRGAIGAIAAAVGMTLPGALFVFILGLLYAQFKSNREVGAVLSGVCAAAVGNCREPELAELSEARAQQLNRIFYDEVLKWLRRHVDEGEIRKLPSDIYLALWMGPANEFTRLWLLGTDRDSRRIARAESLLASAAWAAWHVDS
jgi:hypothetical protein